MRNNWGYKCQLCQVYLQMKFYILYRFIMHNCHLNDITKHIWMSDLFLYQLCPSDASSKNCSLHARWCSSLSLRRWASGWPRAFMWQPLSALLPGSRGKLGSAPKWKACLTSPVTKGSETQSKNEANSQQDLPSLTVQPSQHLSYHTFPKRRMFPQITLSR